VHSAKHTGEDEGGCTAIAKATVARCGEECCPVAHAMADGAAAGPAPDGGAVAAAQEGGGAQPGRGGKRATEADVLRRQAALKDAKAKAEQAARTAVYEAQRARTHWDFLLQEMAWMAADFAGERLWKLAAASKLASAAQRAVETQTLRPAAAPVAPAEDAATGRPKRAGAAMAAGVAGTCRHGSVGSTPLALSATEV
jgi:HSA